jgi:hypothetical protein
MPDLTLLVLARDVRERASTQPLPADNRAAEHPPLRFLVPQFRRSPRSTTFELAKCRAASLDLLGTKSNESHEGAARRLLAHAATETLEWSLGWSLDISPACLTANIASAGRSCTQCLREHHDRMQPAQCRTHHLLARENTNTDTALISSGLSVPSKAGMTARRPLVIDSWIDARSEPHRYKSGRVKFVDPIGS